MTTTTLADLLEQRTDSALRRADSLTQARYGADAPFDVVRSVEVEQALDDADRYARLYDRLREHEARVAQGPYGPGGPSMIADMLNAKLDPEARRRIGMLKRDAQRQSSLGTRAVGTTAVVGLTPPAYITSAVATQVAAGRPLADLIGSRPIPEQGMTVEMGRVTTGNSAAAQTAENAAAATTDIVVAGVSIPVRTIATTATVSQQLFERAAGGGYQDGLIGDMLEAHAATVDGLIITGTGASGQPTGFLSQGSTQTLAYDDGTPTGAEMMPKLAAVSSSASTARKRPVNTYVMHSRRWFWLASRIEANLTMIGDRSIMGVDVLLDNNIPTNLGGGTNEDRVLCIRPDDHHLYESPAYVLVAPEAATGSHSVVVTVYSYLAFTAARYPTGVGILTGTALNAVAA